MKFRTDFVTNSSSSGFVCITVTMRDGTDFSVEYDYDSGWGEWLDDLRGLESYFDEAMTGADILNAVRTIGGIEFGYNYKEFARKCEQIRSVSEIANINLQGDVRFDDDVNDDDEDVNDENIVDETYEFMEFPEQEESIPSPQSHVQEEPVSSFQAQTQEESDGKNYYGGYSRGDEGHNRWHDNYNYTAPISDKTRSASEPELTQDPLETFQKVDDKWPPVQLSVSDCNIHGDILCGYSGKEQAIILPGGISRIDNEAFRRHYSLKSVVIPEGVDSIGERAFFGCVSLESVRLPQSLRKIGYQAFYDCDRLTDLYIGASVNKILWDAFPDGVTIHTPKGSPTDRYCIKEQIWVCYDYPDSEGKTSAETKPVSDESLKKYICCLTGDFNYGSKEDVEHYIVARGGVCKSSMTKAVNMLIIGGLGSYRYSFGSYGRKYVEAKERQDKGENMTILTEEEFFERFT